MKKYRNIITAISILLLISLFSCSKEDINEIANQDCNCIEETYTNETYICYGSTGLPSLCFEQVVISSRNVECQDEFYDQELADGSFIRVVCNE